MSLRAELAQGRSGALPQARLRGPQEHDQLGHGLTCYEEVSHVPFMIHAPGVAPGVRDDLVETLGILPTVAVLLGLPANPAWQGVNVLDAASCKDRPAFCWTTGPWESMDIEINSVQMNNWKLVVDQRANLAELFNLKSDPGELQDVAASHPEQAGLLKKLLAQHKTAAVAARGNRPGYKVDVDEDTLQQLKSIGYLGS